MKSIIRIFKKTFTGVFIILLVIGAMFSVSFGSYFISNLIFINDSYVVISTIAITIFLLFLIASTIDEIRNR